MSMTALLFLGSVLAGWIDAVVGGGGLILIPLLMIVNPSLTNAQALGVNKVAAVMGTASSAWTLSRRVPSATKALKYAPLALLAAAGGSLLASSIDRQIMRPVIIVLLVAVGVFVTLRPNFGSAANKATAVASRRTVLAKVIILIAVVGFYDGAFGPGTGLFLIMGFTSLLHGDFLESAAWAKIINVCTNLGALITFTLAGEVLWALGLTLAVGNVIGAQIGARMVVSKGTGFIRAVLLVLVVVMATKLGVDFYNGR